MSAVLYGDDLQSSGGLMREDLEREVASAYERHFTELMVYATSLARNADAALDAVQEVFFRYFVELRYGRAVDNVRAWLYRVLRNHLLDRLNTAAVRREVLTNNIVELPDPRRGVDTTIWQAEMAERVTSLLTPRELDCLRLRAEGLSYEEIGDVLGIRSGTVSALLTRTHKKLRQEIGVSSHNLGIMEALYYLLQKESAYSS